MERVGVEGEDDGGVVEVEVEADEGKRLWAAPSSCVMLLLLSCGDIGMGEIATFRFFPARVTRVVAGAVPWLVFA